MHEPTRKKRSGSLALSGQTMEPWLLARKKNLMPNQQKYFLTNWLSLEQRGKAWSSSLIIRDIIMPKSYLLGKNEHSEFFQLEFLPPYSPELNHIERVWKLTRRLRTHNQYFAKLDELRKAVFDQFSGWAKPNQELAQLCAIN